MVHRRYYFIFTFPVISLAQLARPGGGGSSTKLRQVKRPT